MSRHNHTPIAVRIIPIAVIIAIAAIATARNCSADKPTPEPTPLNTPAEGIDTMALAMPSTPESTPSFIKHYTGFTVSFNPQRHTPNWVACVLTQAHTDGPHKRHNKFWQDTDIPGCPDPKDYSYSGYDRGHMVPAADQKWSPQAMNHSFSMANMVPQDPDLNAHAWASLERMARRLAQSDTTVLVISGPIYLPSDTTHLPSSKILIPSAFFKVITKPWGDKPWARAYIYPNMAVKSQPSTFAVTIRQIEQLTGLDFLHTLPSQLQDKLETTITK